MKTAGFCGLIAALALAPSSLLADTSAQFNALLHDVTAPYGDDKYSPPPEKRAAYDKAREILRKERLLGSARPSTGASDLGALYRNPLALGDSVGRTAPELAQLHSAALGHDREGVRNGIEAVYAKLGRKTPAGAALDKLVDASIQAAETGRGGNEAFERKTDDYELRGKYSAGANKVAAEVESKDQDGKPFRAKFAGDVKGEPSSNGKGVEPKASPDPKPRIVDEKESKRLAESITGDWIDGEQVRWTITLNGNALTATTPGRNQREVVYTGTYKLGAVKASHKIEHADDITEDMPDAIRHELATSYQPSFEIALDVSEDATKMEGTWTSRHVTYSQENNTVKKVHDPYDRPLILERSVQRKVVAGAKEGEAL